MSPGRRYDGGYPDTDIRFMVHVQIEFYFSDSNLPRDAFMAERIAEDPEVWFLTRAGVLYLRVCLSPA